MKNVKSPSVRDFLQAEFPKSREVQNSILLALSAQEVNAKTRALLIEGIGSSTQTWYERARKR